MKINGKRKGPGSSGAFNAAIIPTCGMCVDIEDKLNVSDQLVIRGLDPRIHPSSEDGLPDQVRQ
jgi:hypothetical protein